MTIEAKNRLSKAGDSGVTAQGFRLEAAIKATGLTKTDFAERCGQALNVVINATKGRNYPSLQALELLFKSYRIDPAFIMFGEWGGLPTAVQDRVFDALQALESAAGKADRRG